MNDLLRELQYGEDADVPYNRAKAFFIVLYFMRQNYLALNVLKNMELIIGNYNGLLKGDDLLKPKALLYDVKHLHILQNFLIG